MDWRDVEGAVDHAFALPEGGRYERGAELGWGGMGRVIAARDLRLNRDVALKEVVATAASGSHASARLAREASITARLDHPAIVPVFDAGVGEDGQLYYTMRLIRGRTLAAAFHGADDLRGRLGLLRHLLDVCEAMAFAHSVGIIHRDLKPANLMVGEFGETQVMDWGLARAEGDVEPAAESTVLGPDQTAIGAVVGTPRYMSPEQARGESADARSDVWSLGLVLRELLSGVAPFEGFDSKSLLAAVGAADLPPFDQPDAPPELVAIADRALQASPDDRYPSARELSEDLARYIDGRLVAAHSYTPWDHLRRLAKAWKAPLTVGAVAAIALVTFAVVAYQRNSAERERAVAAEGETSVALELADQRLGRSLATHATRAWEIGAWPEAEVLAAHALGLVESPEARGVIAGLSSLARARRVDVVGTPDCASQRLAPDGSFVLCSDGGLLALWDRGADAPRWSVPASARLISVDLDSRVLHHGWVGGLARRSLADGRELLTVPNQAGGGRPLAAASAGPEHIAFVDAQLFRVFDASGATHESRPCGPESAVAASVTLAGFLLACDGGTLLQTDRRGAVERRWAALEARIQGFITSIDRRGDLALLGTEGGELWLIDLARDAVVRRIDTDGDPIWRAAWLTDGRVAVASERGGVRLWSPEAGVWAERFPRGAARQFGVSDGELITLGASWSRWSFEGAARMPAVSVGPGITAARIAPDAQHLVTLDGVGQLRVWALPEGRPVAQRSWQSGVLKDGAFSLDGATFLASSAIEGSRLFDTTDWTPVVGPGDRRYPARRVARLTSGFVSLRYSKNSFARLRSASDGFKIHLIGKVGELHDLSARADGSGAAAIGAGGAIRWLDADAEDFEDLPSAGSPRAVATAHTRDRLVLGYRDGAVLVERKTGEVVHRFDGPEEAIVDVVVSPDDRWVAAGTLEGTVRVWDLESGALAASLRAHTKRVASVEFEPSGGALWTGSWDGVARRLDLTHVDTDPAVLLRQAQDSWSLTLDDALDAIDR